MTWAKYGVEFFDELADMDLSDAAVRTHAEAIGYVYRTERTSLLVPKRSLRRFAGSPDHERAVVELIARGCWQADGDAYLIVHHAEVIRQSIAAQRAKRDGDKERQRKHRKKADVTRDVTPDITRDVRATQTDRHTDNQATEDDARPARADSTRRHAAPSRPRTTREIATARDKGGPDAQHFPDEVQPRSPGADRYAHARPA